jgi:hypothetical protein
VLVDGSSGDVCCEASAYCDEGVEDLQTTCVWCQLLCQDKDWLCIWCVTKLPHCELCAAGCSQERRLNGLRYNALLLRALQLGRQLTGPVLGQTTVNTLRHVRINGHRKRIRQVRRLPNGRHRGHPLLSCQLFV